MIRFNPLFSPLFSVDDEYIRYDDGHTSGAPQEPEHQNMAGPHCSMGPHFQHRYKHYFYFTSPRSGPVCLHLSMMYKPV